MKTTHPQFASSNAEEKHSHAKKMWFPLVLLEKNLKYSKPNAGALERRRSAVKVASIRMDVWN